VINFRYHVVSLTAVFLALAIGLVVGTAALNGPVADSLKASVDGLSKDNQQLRQSVQNLEKELELEEDFAAEVAQVMLPGTLTGRRVLVVVLPSGRDQADGIVEMLATTGATMTGRVDVQEKLVNPENNSALMELAVTAARPTVPTDGLPGNGHGVETSSALLASALLDRTAGGTPASESDRRAVLKTYADEGYLNVEEPVAAAAEAVVVISGPPYVDKDATTKDDSVVKVVEQFDQHAHLVVAGNGSAGGNVVAQVRADPALSQTISTVDNANTIQGQLVTALALAEQITTDVVGQYGVGTDAALLPKLRQ